MGFHRNRQLEWNNILPYSRLCGERRNSNLCWSKSADMSHYIQNDLGDAAVLPQGKEKLFFLAQVTKWVYLDLWHLRRHICLGCDHVRPGTQHNRAPKHAFHVPVHLDPPVTTSYHQLHLMVLHIGGPCEVAWQRTNIENHRRVSSTLRLHSF